MDSFSLMFCVVRSCMVFTGLGLNSPAPEFQFYSTNSLKTSPTCSTGNKTSGLMVKRFTTVRVSKEFFRVT